MDTKGMIKKLMKDNNSSQYDLANKLGYSKHTGVANLMARNNIQMNTLLKVCEVYGYEIVIKPKYGDNRAERTIVVDSAGEEQ